jgi:hypothetical protein
MKLTLFLIMLILISLIAMFISYSGCNSGKTMPKQYEMQEEDIIPLDLQFSDQNRPSLIHKDMFNESSPWIGGYQLGIGKTYVTSTPILNKQQRQR